MPPFRVVLVGLLCGIALAPEGAAYGLTTSARTCTLPLAGFPFEDMSLGPPILVADADPHVPMALGLALRELGFSTVAASTLPEAEVVARERAIGGAFISDTFGVEGSEFAHRLHDERHIPVVMLSAGFIGDRVFPDGFVHLGKPFEVRAVWRAARSFIDPTPN